MIGGCLVEVVSLTEWEMEKGVMADGCEGTLFLIKPSPGGCWS